MTNQTESRILAVRDGRVVCPVCGRKTDQVVLDDTFADNLAIFCKWCKNTGLVVIGNGAVMSVQR